MSHDGAPTHTYCNTLLLNVSPQDPIDLEEFGSVAELETVGGDRLKHVLQSMGLKCGGTVRERAERLFSTKGKALSELDPSLFAKAGKQKKRKRK